jgi:hypothetical protein
MDHENLHELAEEIVPANRMEIDVGGIHVLRNFDGRCLGDDVSRRGLRVTRLTALQTAGCSGSHLEWGRWWGRALQDLGADVGVLSETRIAAEDHHTRAVQGLMEMGFVAVSHNVAPVSASTSAQAKVPGEKPARSATEFGPRSSGVVLAVRKQKVGDLLDVSRGPHGRAVAATLPLAAGGHLRAVGVYGPTGACCQTFPYRQGSLQVERDLGHFLQEQADKADSCGMHIAMLGDLNSFTDEKLDCWGGRIEVRDACVARVLQDCNERGTRRSVPSPASLPSLVARPASTKCGSERLQASICRCSMRQSCGNGAGAVTTTQPLRIYYVISLVFRKRPA